MNTPTLGQLITDGDRRRDAVHIAVAPVTAAHDLLPGQRVGFVRESDREWVGETEITVGIVDPYLTASVKPGERFWLFLYPNTIESLRHVWTHPAFSMSVPKVKHD